MQRPAVRHSPRASCTWHNYQFEPRASGWLMLPTTLQSSPPKINAANDKIPSPLSSCCSWALFRRSSSRRSRGRCISSPWAKGCPRRCSRPGHARTASGKHSPSPSCVRMKSSSRDFFLFFFWDTQSIISNLNLKQNWENALFASLLESWTRRSITLRVTPIFSSVCQKGNKKSYVKK